MNNIFMFWIGDSREISSLKSSLTKRGFRVHVGPTKEEHEYLYSNFDYYKVSFDQKIWSFCSDVWRFYMLSKHSGMYTDTSIVIGDDFENFYKENIANSVTLFKEVPGVVATAVLFSGKEKNVFFSNLLEIYRNLKIEFDNTRVIPIAPCVLTGYINREYSNISALSEENILSGNDIISIKTLKNIRCKETIFKQGKASWVRNNKFGESEAKKYWETLENKWDNGWNSNEIYFGYSQDVISFTTNRSAIAPWIGNIRAEYDASKSKLELKNLRKCYRNIDYTIRFSNRLIWSILFRIFSFKRAF